MSRTRSISLIAAAAAIAALPAAAEAKSVAKGPSGAAFYTPPAKLAAKHGTLLRARKVPGSARTKLLLYTQTGVEGSPVATSGRITYPKGKAPKQGWPVVTWAHGTSGIADQCAPSRTASPDSSSDALFTRWLNAGWAIARTDYEGLGTPGTHPYLIGTSEGRATLDVVTAAAQAGTRINVRRVVISGHSQGGHAALWANSLAPSYSADLKIRGTVAFAPESHTGEQALAIAALTTPSGLSGLAAMILRGAEVQDPSLNIVDLLNPAAAALYPRVDTECSSALGADDAFGALAPADLIKPYADVTPVVDVLSANDSEELTIHGPLRIEQGADDTTVFPSFTDQTVEGYEDRGYKVDYDKRDGLTHGTIVTTASVQKAATKWIAKRLG